jgi:hypothetical protein
MGRRAGRLLVAFALALSTALVIVPRPPALRAVQQPAPSWERSGLTESASKLFAHASGALFAVLLGGPGPARLVRSDNAGTTWRLVPPPPRPEGTVERFGWLIAVDPADPNIVYSAGPDGLYKTENDGAAWRLIYPAADILLSVSALRVSAADRNLLYVHLFTRASGTKLLRSQDAGASWTTLSAAELLCPHDESVVFDPHPGDSQQLFATTTCEFGAKTADLSVSGDQGASWSVVLDGAARDAFPRRLVGGSGVRPGRLYLAATRHVHASGLMVTPVFRSDDAGRTWTESLPFGAGGSELGPAGLAVDPSSPDLVFVAHASVFRTSEVRMSADGGESWVDFGGRGLGTIADLALSADGQDLFMATNSGVHRARVR